MLTPRCRESTTPCSRATARPHHCKSTTLRSRATARPYGSKPYSLNWPKNKHFLFQSQFDFLHARVRVAPPPNNSANLRHPNQLAALLNY